MSVDPDFSTPPTPSLDQFKSENERVKRHVRFFGTSDRIVFGIVIGFTIVKGLVRAETLSIHWITWVGILLATLAAISWVIAEVRRRREKWELAVAAYAVATVGFVFALLASFEYQSAKKRAESKKVWEESQQKIERPLEQQKAKQEPKH